MTLRRQIFISFVLVALLPLVVVAGYLFHSNFRLAFNLYEQNLYNSTEIQADMLDDNINRFLVRAKRFSSSKAVKAYLAAPSSENILNSAEAASEITKFTDETLDSVNVFAVEDASGEVCYASGSNSDNAQLSSVLGGLAHTTQQSILEIPWGNSTSLLSVTPIFNERGGLLGRFAVVYCNDYFLKAISGHRQIENSNSFIYSVEREQPVESKYGLSGSFEPLQEAVKTASVGVASCQINGKKNILQYRTITKTPWALVNSIPITSVYRLVLSYGLISLAVFAAGIAAVVLLSRRQSRRVMQPLNNFLNQVEAFFVSGTPPQPPEDLNKKTEIGYLEDRFVGLTTSMSAAQEGLRESNYLYESILHATYCMRISVDFKENLVTAYPETLQSWFDKHTLPSASDKAMRFFLDTQTSSGAPTMDLLRGILHGEVRQPAETELCCVLGNDQPENWFRVIAAPILENNGSVRKVVLHFEDITAKKSREFHLMDSAQHDPLCGLLNKQAFLNHADKYAEMKNSGAVFFIDLDNFKLINDNWGHAAGDELLVKTARILTEQFRSADLVARYGGDEFVVFAPAMSRAGAELKASALVRELSVTWQTKTGEPVHVTASVGVFLSSMPRALSDMLHQADSAMYLAKQNGKSQYAILEDE